MNKKLMLGICILAIAILAYGTLGSGAWWSIPTSTSGQVVAATFDVTAGVDEAAGTCTASNLAPGDDPITCKILITNNSTIPINVLWSGFTLNDSNGMADWVFITDFADWNGETTLSDIASFAGPDGKMSLREIAVPLGNGYFSDPDSVNGYGSTFVPAGQIGWVSITFAFGADAPNSTIDGQAEFTWNLTAQQLPKNPAP